MSVEACPWRSETPIVAMQQLTTAYQAFGYFSINARWATLSAEGSGPVMLNRTNGSPLAAWDPIDRASLGHFAFLDLKPPLLLGWRLHCA